MKTYQEIFNNTLKSIRLITNAMGNKSLGDTLAKLMFDFSDELKDNGIIMEVDTDHVERGNKV